LVSKRSLGKKVEGEWAFLISIFGEDLFENWEQYFATSFSEI
jgi:hypothetical protein